MITLMTTEFVINDNKLYKKQVVAPLSFSARSTLYLLKSYNTFLYKIRLFSILSLSAILKEPRSLYTILEWVMKPYIYISNNLARDNFMYILEVNLPKSHHYFCNIMGKFPSPSLPIFPPSQSLKGYEILPKSAWG